MDDSGGYNYNEKDVINYDAESELIETIKDIYSIRINSKKCLGECLKKYLELYKSCIDNQT